MRDHKFTCILFLFLLIFSGANACLASIDTDTLQVTDNMTEQYTGETIIVDGNIEVKDNASLTFRDCNVTVLWNRGSIPGVLVSDWGELVLQNTTLWIRADLNPFVTTSGEINVADYGRLVLNNSVITCTDTVLMFLSGDSRVEFTGSGFSGTAPQASQHWYIEELMPPGAIEGLDSDYNIYASGNSSITAYGSELGDVNLHDDTECSIEDSKVTLFSPGSSRETICKDTEIKILSVSLRNTSVSITDSISGYYEQLILNEILENTRENLRLLDCTVELTRLSLVDCTSVLDEANLWQIRTSGGETTIKDSEITIANLYYGNITIMDSDIVYLLGNCQHGKLRVQSCECDWVSLTGTGYNLDGVHNIWAEFNDTDIGDCVINYMSIVEEVDVFFNDVSLQNIKIKSAQRFNLLADNLRIENSTTIISLSSYPIHIRGSIEFLKDDLTVHQNAILRHEYKIQVLEEGIPVPDKLVEIYKDNELIAAAKTDHSGAVFFNVSWIEGHVPGVYMYDEPINKVNESLMVRVDKVEEKISALSDSPIEIEIDKPVFPAIYAVIITSVLVLYITWIFRRKRL